VHANRVIGLPKGLTLLRVPGEVVLRRVCDGDRADAGAPLRDDLEGFPGLALRMVEVQNVDPVGVLVVIGSAEVAIVVPARILHSRLPGSVAVFRAPVGQFQALAYGQELSPPRGKLKASGTSFQFRGSLRSCHPLPPWLGP
jgi:hypothetical protein